jgi:hypothetical protein
VQLQFLARPDDFNAQKTSWASSLAALPFYDPVWYAAATFNPDTVLETYSALWHIDRVSLALSISDILEGEDGIIDVGEDLSIYDHFSLAYGEPPLVATSIVGTVTWSQQAEGAIDVTQPIVRAFSNAGSAYNDTFATSAFNTGGGGLIQCLCGAGLKSDWPKPGTSIGGGWTLSSATDGRGVPLCYILDATNKSEGGWILPQNYFGITFEGSMPPDSQAGNTEEQSNVAVYLNAVGTFSARFPLNVYKIRMTLNYQANRKRTETVSAVVMAGVQQELSDSSENDREAISLTSELVGQAVDFDGAVPIGNVAYRSYFQTARGAASFEYLLLAARAKMRARARSVDITFAIAWRPALDITLRHNVRLTDRRLPGGNAIGKVKAYKLTCADGVMLGEFTIGCSIGTGLSTAPQPGAPCYVDPGYVDGYQVITGAQVSLAAADGDFAYETLDDFVVVDDGLDLTRVTAAAVVNQCIVTNGLSTQVPALGAFDQMLMPKDGNPMTTMSQLSTSVTLDLKPVQDSEFHTDFFPAVTPLILPKTIDLSAPLPGA